MESQIIIILNQKGGVGKTSTTVNLYHGLSKRNKKVLIIDLDPQAHSSSIFIENIDKNNSIQKALLDSKSDIKELIQKASVNAQIVENLFIVPSTIHLALVAEQICSRTYREKILFNQLKKIQNNFDYVIIDCPPNLGILTLNAIYAAQKIIIPSTYAKYSLDGIADLFNSIKEIKEDNYYNYYILRNSYDSRNKLTNSFVGNELENFNKNLLNTIMRKTESINQSQISNETVYSFDPNSKAVEDFESLVTEILLL